ncbi:hypothetical protein H2200_011640 [Cladophialophora chaetospira]|uniref:Heterokaryon incompatibility domain-containing protein n=1 Tax=Cladophialophora chaetospira TaxID=386627 RepID=A0AA39CDF0_9EURO|nr:hypothetical protein H2200_011640 [Cladophialophora chaetospira]
MEVTSRLGLRYLWIDSLCILQDPEKDWKAAAALMGDTYRNAYCNIAATAAEDGTCGLFVPRTLLDVEPCRVVANWRGHHRQPYYCHGIGVWEREIEEQPLLSRAWVAQEVTLATRVIHFSRTEIFWECLEKRARESFVDGIPNFTAKKLSVRARDERDREWFQLDDGDFPFHEVWKNAVQLYSRGELTYRAKDKLIAISGIARSLPLPNEDYLAGLWQQGLSEQLLWTASESNGEGSTKTARSSEYRAPTWSWASVDGPVLMTTPSLSALNHASVDILEARTTLIDPSDRYGQVSDGFIRVRGMLAFGQLSQRVTTTTTRHSFSNGQVREVPLDSGVSGQTIVHRFRGDCHINIFLDVEDPHPGGHYHCLLVSQQYGGCGLVIKPTGARRGEYTRRGYFAVLTALQPDSPSHFVKLCGTFEAATQDNEMLYEAKADVTSEGVQQYIISLV